MRKHGISLLLVSIFIVSARSEGFPVKSLPAEGRSLQAFVPRGWSVEQQANGDLNGDGVSDIAAILVQTKAEDEDQRALIVLFGHAGGNLTLAGTNDKLIQCKGCGGIKEGVEVEIRKGIAIVEQDSGSREFARGTWRFRYDAQARRFLMIGKDIETGDGMRGTGKTESFNYLTGLKITETYRLAKDGERKIVTSSKKEQCPKETPFLEDVSDVFAQ